MFPTSTNTGLMRRTLAAAAFVAAGALTLGGSATPAKAQYYTPYYGYPYYAYPAYSYYPAYPAYPAYYPYYSAYPYGGYPVVGITFGGRGGHHHHRR